MTRFKRQPRRFLSCSCTFLKDFRSFSVKEPSNALQIETVENNETPCFGVCRSLRFLAGRASPGTTSAASNPNRRALGREGPNAELCWQRFEHVQLAAGGLESIYPDVRPLSC